MAIRFAEPLDLLARGAITLRGRLPRSSNATFLVDVALDGARALGVYKPARGERPLWDFPAGLFRREVAAHALSEALGWGLVPLTVVRDGPLGEGSLQRFVDADPDHHYFTLSADRAHRDRLRLICLFDLLANNADRKSGHCLLGRDGAVWAIDNALTFHADFKLRTVIWDFGGQPIPRAWLADIRRLLAGPLPEPLPALLAPEEVDGLHARGEALVRAARFPRDPGPGFHPWPPV
jgi:uncharacterized repeat protein (TIGR03843 family)